MQPAPPTLTSERIDAMLSVVAETCLAGVTEAGARLSAAADMADFERAGRTLSTVARNLRQTIVLKQRYDRERAVLEAEARRGAEAEHRNAEQARAVAIGLRHARVRRHFEQVLWDEYEGDDAQEIFDDLDERLDDLSGEAGFLETPVETLIARLTEAVGIGAALDDDPSDDDPPAGDGAADDDPARVETLEPADPPMSADETAEPPPVAAPPDDVAARRLEPDPPPDPSPAPDPPPRPPDPYIPPWERLRPGQSFPGGSGW